jgi:hypothetical protein
MTERQVILLVAFAISIALALFARSDASLGLVIGGFLSLGWHLRKG